MKKGFTLIELIVVIGVLGVLSMILLPNIINYIERSQSVTCLNNIKYATREITAQKLLDNDFVEDDFLLSHKICPSDGIVTITKSSAVINIKCDKHTENHIIVNDANTNVQDMIDIITKCQALSTNDANNCLKEYGFEPGYMNNDKFRKAYLEKFGTFEKLSQELSILLGYSDTQYYQPYYKGSSKESFMFVNSCDGQKCHGLDTQWDTNAIFYNGKWYKNDTQKVNIASINGYSESIDQYLKDKGFTIVN